MRRLRAVAAVVALTLGFWPGPSESGPITFNSAITLSSGEFVFREQIVLGRSGGGPAGSDSEGRSLAALSVLGYGVDPNLSVFAVLPYRDKRLEVTGAGGRLSREGDGLGDVRLFGRYTLLRRNWRVRAFRLSPFVGIELPTGEDDERDGAGRVPPGVQPGSGSWDPFLGVVATYQTLDFQVDGQLAYQVNTAANNVELGDVARADASLQYRLWPRELGGGVPTFLYGVLEANLVRRGKVRVGGMANPNSGGTTLFLSPGLQVVARRWVVEAVVQVPLIQNLGGAALEDDFILRAGFRVNF